MHLTVLAVPDCPNAPVLNDRLAAVLDGRAGVEVSYEVIRDEGEATRRGMHGSPTLVIDGVDPFAKPGQAPTMSCRIYRDESGQLSGAPSLGQLRQAIRHAPATTAEPRDPAWLDSLARSGRGRVAPAERRLRAVHQAVLRSFVNTGAAPDTASLAEHAATYDVSQALAELAEGDFLVRISGGRTVFAMCAIDALGVSAMVGAPVVIESADPSTGEPVTVNVDGSDSTWDPAKAVVYVGRTGDVCAGPSASVAAGT
jgi:hypothetical protein